MLQNKSEDDIVQVGEEGRHHVACRKTERCPDGGGLIKVFGDVQSSARGYRMHLHFLKEVQYDGKSAEKGNIR